MQPLCVSIVTPERPVVTQTADQVVAPSVNGEVGILPMHSPLLADLEEGVVGLHVEDQVAYYAVSSGFLEVNGGNVTLLVESAEAADEIDVTRAEGALKDSEEKLKTLASGTEEHDSHWGRARRAAVRLDVAKKARK